MAARSSAKPQRLLYLTIDGILGHIGFSQVVRLLERLSALGHDYTIVSLERDQDLANEERVEWLRQRLTRTGLRWIHGRYETGGGAAVVRNQARFAALAVRAVLTHRITHVHARSYHAALVAMALGKPWLFDARGYWIDERIDEGRWFTSPARLAAARALERQMYTRASRVVTLTELQAEDTRRTRGEADTTIAIPTCADYDEFVPRAYDGPRDPVIGIVGSANGSYRIPETAELAAAVVRLNPRAQIRVLSAQHGEWRAALETAGVPSDRIRGERVGHEQMPAALSELSWVIMLLTPEAIAKRGSMPTKLGECFAAGVRVCVYGCNPEVEGWVKRAGGGVVMPDLGSATLERAGRFLGGASPGEPLARERSAPHFSLTSGVDRYDALLAAWA
jgi:hypothetical protein